MAKWTDGPWELVIEKHQWLVGPVNRKFKDVFISLAKLVCLKGLTDEDRANAYLISAAPDLYEGLDAIISDDHPDTRIRPDHIHAARVALAKARGEE